MVQDLASGTGEDALVFARFESKSKTFQTKSLARVWPGTAALRTFLNQN